MKVWNGEKMLGPFDLSVNPVYLKGLEDGERLLYTGLLDINGSEIYEKDLIEDEDGELYEVGFKCGAFGFYERRFVSRQEKHVSIFNSFYNCKNLYFKVISNVLEKERDEGGFYL